MPEPEDTQTSTNEIKLNSLPQNLEAEQNLLGTILINNKVYERVSEFLRPEHFANPLHKKIYEACARLIGKGHTADPITLKGFFEQSEELKEAGGFKYLNALSNMTVTSLGAEDYGHLIYDCALRRELISVGQDMVSDAFRHDFETEAIEQIEKAEKKLFDLATEGTVGGLQDFSSALLSAIKNTEEAYKREGHLAGISSGFIDLDKKLGGLNKSDLIILAGRPSMGKTSLATNIAYNAADIMARNKEKSSVAFFSLEMSSDQLAARILSTVTQTPSHKMRVGDLTSEEFTRLAAGVRELEKIPLFIDDTPGITVANMRTRARRLKREKGLGLIVVDYIQLISAAAGQRIDNRVQVVSEITRGLKILAKELDVPVIALSQLSRGPESRDDKRPMLADLRESGSIEQDADVVMFVFREFYYKERETLVQKPNESPEQFIQRQNTWEYDKEALRNKAEAIISKQRHGPTGTVNMFFNGEFTQFGDWIEDDRLPDNY